MENFLIFFLKFFDEDIESIFARRFFFGRFDRSSLIDRSLGATFFKINATRFIVSVHGKRAR